MVNKVILIGNVGADPEVRYLEGGVAVANLRLATTERYKNKNGENIDQTDGITSYYGEDWLKRRKVCQKRNASLYRRTDSYPFLGRPDGVKRYTTEIYADNMQMLSSRQDGEATEMLPDLIRRRFQVALQRPLLLR